MTGQNRQEADQKKMGEMKKKKGRKYCPKKEASGTGIPSWPNLPLKNGPVILKNITGLGGVTKSWISSSSCFGNTSWPQLVEINIPPEVRLPHRRISSSATPETFVYNAYNGGELRRGYLKGYSHERLVYLSGNLCIMLGGCAGPPRWDNSVPFKFATLSSVPDYSRRLLGNRNTIGNVMVITGISSPAFAFYRWDSKDYCCVYGDRISWKMVDCRLNEPYSSNRFMEFTNAIGLKGKYYAISRQGSLALIEDNGNFGKFEITALGRNRAVPSKPCRHFREYLLEHKGEIFLVFLVSRASVNVVDDVEVFRLDTSRLMWEKVDRLGNAMFFVEDKCCMGISASLLGCSRGNRVYFTHGGVDTWLVFDMKTSLISATYGPEADLTESQISD